MFALDSRIEERKANIARLETTERDIEECISIKEKHVKRLLKKIGIMEDFLELQEDLEDAKEAMEDMEAQLQEAEGARESLEENVDTLEEELLTLKKTVGQLERSSEICSGIDGNC